MECFFGLRLKMDRQPRIYVSVFKKYDPCPPYLIVSKCIQLFPDGSGWIWSFASNDNAGAVIAPSAALPLLGCRRASTGITCRNQVLGSKLDGKVYHPKNQVKGWHDCLFSFFSGILLTMPLSSNGACTLAKCADLLQRRRSNAARWAAIALSFTRTSNTDRRGPLLLLSSKKEQAKCLACTKLAPNACFSASSIYTSHPYRPRRPCRLPHCNIANHRDRTFPVDWRALETAMDATDAYWTPCEISSPPHPIV